MRTIEFDLPDDFAERLADVDGGDLSKAMQSALKFYTAIGHDEAYAKFTETAKSEGIGKAAMFNKMVMDYLTSGTHYEVATDGQKGTYNRLSKSSQAHRATRNRAIMQMVEEGLTRATIAKSVKLSVIRVNQIVADERAKAKLNSTFESQGIDTEV